MKNLAILVLAGSAIFATPASANHVLNLDTPYKTRGACEAASAHISSDDRLWLDETFPDVFSSDGEVMSFLTRAFTCERNADDGQYYFIDHREDVLESDWFARRNH